MVKPRVIPTSPLGVKGTMGCPPGHWAAPGHPPDLGIGPPFPPQDLRWDGRWQLMGGCWLHLEAPRADITDIVMISLWWDSYGISLSYFWRVISIGKQSIANVLYIFQKNHVFSSKLPVQVQLVSPHKWLNRGKLRLMRLGHLLLHDGREFQPAAFLRWCIPLHGLWIDMDEMDKRRHIMWIKCHILVSPLTRRPPGDAQPSEPSVITTLQTLLPFSPSFLCEAQQLLLSFQE